MFSIRLLLRMEKFENLLSGVETTFVSNIRLLLFGETPEKKLFLEIVMDGVTMRVEVGCTLK